MRMIRVRIACFLACLKDQKSKPILRDRVHLIGHSITDQCGQDRLAVMNDAGSGKSVQLPTRITYPYKNQYP